MDIPGDAGGVWLYEKQMKKRCLIMAPLHISGKNVASAGAFRDSAKTTNFVIQKFNDIHKGKKLIKV